LKGLEQNFFCQMKCEFDEVWSKTKDERHNVYKSSK
jgi:hypothetical protein